MTNNTIAVLFILSFPVWLYIKLLEKGLQQGLGASVDSQEYTAIPLQEKKAPRASQEELRGKYGVLDCRGWDIHQKRKLLRSFEDEQYFIHWITKAGKERMCHAYTWRHFLLSLWPIVLDNSVAHMPKYWTCVDVDKEEGWVNVSLDKLIEIRKGRQVYRFV